MKWIRRVLCGLAVVLLLLHTAPFIARDQAVIWLQQQGAENVGLRALRIGWWRGRFELDGLRAEAGGRLPLNVGKLWLDIELPRLFDQQLLVSELSLADVESGIRLRDDQLWLGPVNLSALQAEPDAESPEASAPGAWRFGVDRVRIDRFDWRTELPDQLHHLVLDIGELNELYQWREQEQSRLRLQGRLNGAPFDIDTQAVPLPADRRSDMQLTLQGFPVESVTAAFVPGLSAELSLQLDLNVEMKGSDGHLRPSGRVRLDNLRFQDEALDLQNGRLSWEGELDLELSGLLPHRLTLKGDVSADALALAQDGALEAGLQRLGWQGDLELSFDERALPQALTMDAVLNLQQPTARQPSGLDAGLDSLGWQGELGLAFASGAPASLNLDGALALAGNRLALPQTLDGRLSALDWRGQLELALGEGAPKNLKAKGALELGETQLQLPGTGAVGLQQGRWDGILALAFAGGQPQDLALSGDLTLGSQRLELAAQQLQGALASLGWSGSLRLHLPEAKRELMLDGGLKVSDFSAESPQLKAGLGDLNWQGTTHLVQQSLSADGGIEASGLAFNQPGQLEARLDSLGGSLQLSSPDLAAFDVRVPAFSAAGFGLEAGPDGYPLASLQALDLEVLELVASRDLSLQGLRLDGLEAARAGKAPLLSAGRLSLADLKYEHGKEARLSRITVNDSSARVRLDEDAKPADIDRLLAVLEALGGAGESGGEAETAASPGDAGLPWQLGRLEFAGKNRLYFEDGSTDPRFSSDVDISRFRVERLGSAITDPSPFVLNARINGFSELEASGAVNLIGGVSDGEWQAILKGVELPAVSPYSIRYTGYYINSGQLHVRAQGSLSDRQLDGTNHIRLNRVAVERVDADQSAELASQLSMPLETALAVLQDDDQNIELDVPISGSLDSPDFGYQSLINIIVEKGVKTAAMGFLSNALQPYGALITLAGMAADASKSGSAIELTPVEFAAGSAALDGGQDYLDKIATMLEEREGLRLNLCGQAVLRDREVLQPALAEEQADADEALDEAGMEAELKRRLQGLADARAAAVKDYLDDRVDDDRLFLCYSRLALEEAEAQPVVFLGL